MTNDLLNSIILRLLDDANDILDDHKKEPDEEFIKGEKLAYYMVLDTIKNQLEIADYDLSACGLDIDLDKKYM